MRRTVCAIVILLMAVLSVTASGCELSSLGLDELIALKKAVNQELSERFSLDGNRLYGGVYIVGIDIIPGKYALLVDTLDDGYFNANIYLYENEELYSENIEMDNGSLHCSLNGSLYLNLKDGMVIELLHGYGDLHPIDPDYAP